MKSRLTLNLLSMGIFYVLSLFPLQGQAQETMRPPLSRDEVFKGLQLDLEKEKAKAKELAAKKANYQQNLKQLEQKIIPVAEKIQKTEHALIELKEDIAANETRQEELQEILKDNQKLLSDSLLAALRLKRVPSETLFLQASTPLQTAQTAMILERAVPNIKSRMAFLSKSAAELRTVEKSLAMQKNKQEEQLTSLEKQQKEIKGLIKSRQNMIRQTQKDYRRAEQNAARISREATNLKELVKKVQEQNEVYKAKNTRALTPPSSPASKTVVTSQTVSGVNNWPAAGAVKVAYGAPDVYGAKTQGIKIETRPGALVTTPMTGTVRFAGTFKNYNKIAIIEHDGGWHSLIGGMEELNVMVGQEVYNGEPVGQMTSKVNKAGREGVLLYYELRYKGTPVNPARKIKGLS